MKLALVNRRSRQHGYGVIEILIASVLVTIIGAAVASTYFQINQANRKNTEKMETVQSVENAGFWAGRDVLMAQEITATEGSGFPLTITWTDWDGNTSLVTYNISDHNLTRSVSINGASPTQAIIARYIDTDDGNTECFLDEHNLVFTVTATIDQTSETRTYQIAARPNTPEV